MKETAKLEQKIDTLKKEVDELTNVAIPFYKASFTTAYRNYTKAYELLEKHGLSGELDGIKD